VVECRDIRITEYHLRKPLGPDRLDYVSIIRRAEHPDGSKTYHYGSLSTILPDDIGRQRAILILKEQKVDYVDRFEA
jgi:hypothetical protein